MVALAVLKRVGRHHPVVLFVVDDDGMGGHDEIRLVRVDVDEPFRLRQRTLPLLLDCWPSLRRQTVELKLLPDCIVSCRWAVRVATSSGWHSSWMLDERHLARPSCKSKQQTRIKHLERRINCILLRSKDVHDTWGARAKHLWLVLFQKGFQKVLLTNGRR